MNKHTPGPWQAFYKSKYDEWHVSIPMPGSSMGWALFDDGVRSENPEADARLIAAAPELLDVLIRARDAIEALDGTSIENEKIVDDYRAAIAKATGGAA